MKSFQAAKQAAIAALQSGSVTYESRELGKNALADGSVSYLEAAVILAKTRGNQAESRPHHLDRNQTVWVFKPDDWYIKFYLVNGICFISFHPQA